MNKNGYAALEKMVRANLDNGVNRFDPEAIGLDRDSLSELLMYDVVEIAGNINGEIILDPNAAREFLNS